MIFVGHLITLLGALATSCTASSNSIGAASSSANIRVLVAGAGAPLTVIADVPLPGAAKRFDYQSFDPTTGRLYISHMYGNRLDVFDARARKLVASIDARTNTKAGVIPLGGEAGNTRYDSASHCIVVAVQTREELVAVNPNSYRVTQRYRVPCDRPHGFLIDTPHRLAFVTCEGNSKLLVVDMRTMKTITSQMLPEGPDVLAFDPALQRLYIGCESGALAVFEVGGGALRSLGEYRAPHAHTVAVDPATHVVYLPLQDIGGRPLLRLLAPITR